MYIFRWIWIQNWCSICSDNNIDESELEMYFASDFEILGKIDQHELIPGGAQVKVCEENKKEYIE